MTGGRVEVALLGPVECRIDGRAAVIRSRKQRPILSALALRPSEVISTERLIEAVWGEDPPPAARNSLEAHVSRLRKLLEENGASAAVLRTQSPGYAFGGTTDLAQVEQFRAAAAEQADDRAAAQLASGLALWRGAALADLADEPFAAVETPRLEELRLATREELIRSRLALGRRSVGRARAGDARRGAPAARTAPRAPHARLLPVRPPGGGARAVPGDA